MAYLAMPTDLFVMPADLAEVIETHRRLFGGFVMEATDPPADPPAPGQGNPSADPPPATGGEQLNASARKNLEDALKRATDAEARLSALEEAGKTELQKALDAATKAQKERDDLKAAEKARLEADARAAQVKTWTEAAANKTGVAAELIRGGTKEEIEAHAALLEKALPRRGYVPNEGNPPATDGSSELRGLARQLFAPNH